LEWQVAGFGDFNGDGATDMLLRNTNTGAFEVYDINNRQLTSASGLGQVGNEWQVAGFGDGTDMMLRDTITAVFELYDINNNRITSAAAIGQVRLEWQVAGFGPFNGAGTSDMVLRDVNNGAFEVYDIANNQLTAAASLGQVGLEWQVGGFAADPPASSQSIATSNSRLIQAMARFAVPGCSFECEPLRLGRDRSRVRSSSPRQSTP
jgi:serralysin